MPPSLLIQIFAALSGALVLVAGIADLTRRRTADEAATVPISGIFLLFSGLSLLAEAWVNIGEFGIVGGVLLIFAGVAAAVHDSRKRTS